MALMYIPNTNEKHWSTQYLEGLQGMLKGAESAISLKDKFTGSQAQGARDEQSLLRMEELKKLMMGQGQGQMQQTQQFQPQQPTGGYDPRTSALMQMYGLNPNMFNPFGGGSL